MNYLRNDYEPAMRTSNISATGASLFGHQ